MKFTSLEWRFWYLVGLVLLVLGAAVLVFAVQDQQADSGSVPLQALLRIYSSSDPRLGHNFKVAASGRPWVGCPASVPDSPWVPGGNYTGWASYIFSSDFSAPEGKQGFYGLYCELTSARSQVPVLTDAARLWAAIDLVQNDYRYPATGEIGVIVFQSSMGGDLIYPISFDLVSSVGIAHSGEDQYQVSIYDRQWGQLELNRSSGFWVSSTAIDPEKLVLVFKTYQLESDQLTEVVTQPHFMNTAVFSETIEGDLIDALAGYTRVFYSPTVNRDFMTTRRERMKWLTYLAEKPDGSYEEVRVSVDETLRLFSD